MFKFRSFFLPVSLVLVIFAALALTSPVHAQETEQPPDLPVETPILMDEMSPPIEEQPVVDQILVPEESTDAAPEDPAEGMEADTEPEGIDTTNEDEAAPADTLADTVDALADAGAVLLDENGEILPLTSEAAQELLTEEPDPWFTCPVMYDTTDGTPDGVCRYAGATSIQIAVDDFNTRHGSGAIHVEVGSFTGAILIDSVTGLTGLMGAGMENNPATSTVLTGSIEVRYLTTPFTLSGFYIHANQDQAGVYIHENTGTLTLEDLNVTNDHINGEGLVVETHIGAVNLYQVNTAHNGGTGTDIRTTGNATITNSAFDYNGGTSGSTPGLYIEAHNGSVTINGVSASNNTQYRGAHIQYSTNLTIKNSTFVDNSADGVNAQAFAASGGAVLVDTVVVSSNAGMGVYVRQSKGAVTMRNLDINSNDSYGVYIDTCLESGGVCTSNGTGNITIQDSQFNNNLDAGIVIYAYGNIVLSNSSAFANQNWGAWISNAEGPLARTVTVTNSNFNDTYIIGGYGLQIKSIGNVTLNHIVANGNVSGVLVDAANGKPTTITMLGTLGQNEIRNNAQYGLGLSAIGAITVRDTVVDTSGYAGATINNTSSLNSPITLSNLDISNIGTLGGFWFGLDVQTNGVVSLTNVNVHGNINQGARVLNNTSAAIPGVTIIGGGFSDNADGYGLYIQSKGSVTLSNFSANNNWGESGVWVSTLGNITINNISASENSKSGLVLDTTGGTAGSISISAPANATARFENNNFYGVFITSPGTATLSNINCNANGLGGLNINNNFGPANTPRNVTLTNISSRYNSGGDGVNIISDGVVSINGGNYSDNPGDGLDITNTAGKGGVTLSGSGIVANNNGNNGVRVRTNGAFTFNNACELINNDLSGLDVDNTTGTGGVTISSTSGLIANYNQNGDGMRVLTNGTVSINNVSSLSGNGLNGLIVDNTTGIGGVTISSKNGLSANNNHHNGLLILTNGAVTISGVGASENSGDPLAEDPRGNGVYVDNSSGSGGVTFNNSSWLLNANYFNGNTNSGVYVRTNGAIAINNFLSASDNNRHGLCLITTSATLPVSVTGRSSDGLLESNGRDGLNVLAGGSVTLKYLYATGNRDTTENPYGIYVDNTSGLGNVVLNNIEASNNDADGLRVLSRGTITLNYVDASVNDFRGATLFNFSAPTARSITINNSEFSVNARVGTHTGLFIDSRGLVTLNNVVALLNNLDGVYISNLMAPSPLGVNVTGGEVRSNGTGLRIYSLGAISVKNLQVSSNSSGGIFLDNHTGTGSVTLNGDQIIGTISGHGINVYTAGAVTVSGVTSSGTVTIGRGLYIDALSGNGNISISNSIFNTNQYQNLYVLANGSITLNNVTANESIIGQGVWLDNHTSALTTATVSVTNSTFHGNSAYNLYVLTNGSITLNNVTANDSINLEGAYLDNHTSGLTTATVSVSHSTFNGNGYRGLEIWSARAVTLNGVISSNNSAYGAHIRTATNMPVNILSSLRANEFNGNVSAGVYIGSAGSLTGSKITANNSTSSVGLSLYVSGPVTLTTVTTNTNHTGGIYINAQGAITITGLTAISNGEYGTLEYDGLQFDSHGYNVTVTNSFLTGNGRNGIRATLGGAVLTVKASSFFGNDAASGAFDPNIYPNGAGTLVVIR